MRWRGAASGERGAALLAELTSVRVAVPPFDRSVPVVLGFPVAENAEVLSVRGNEERVQARLHGLRQEVEDGVRGGAEGEGGSDFVFHTFSF